MTIVYETKKMTELFPVVEGEEDRTVEESDPIMEIVHLATSATGVDQLHSDTYIRLQEVYRDLVDCWMVTARDDAASNKLVGVFGFSDLNKFGALARSGGGWRNTIRDAIVAKGIDDDADVDVSCAIYVHEDYKGQNIASTMRNKRQEYQLNRGITHSLVVAPATDNIKTWNDMVNTRLGGETIGTDSDGNNIYLCPHGTSL